MIITDDEITEIIRLAQVHRLMLDRCTNPKTASYPNYGGRGIYICEEWLDRVEFIRWSMANGSAKGLHIDRIDNDGPYAPWNCRYVTPTVNMNNRRPGRRPGKKIAEIFGETRTLAEWAKDSRCVVSYSTLRRRIDDFGWFPEEALTVKNKKNRKSRICSQGHPLTPDNVYVRGNGYEICKICAKTQAKKTYDAISKIRIERSK